MREARDNLISYIENFRPEYNTRILNSLLAIGSIGLIAKECISNIIIFRSILDDLCLLGRFKLVDILEHYVAAIMNRKKFFVS